MSNANTELEKLNAYYREAAELSGNRFPLLRGGWARVRIVIQLTPSTIARCSN